VLPGGSAAGIAGLLCPETGIVDYTQVTQAYAAVVRQAGGIVLTEARVRNVHRRAGEPCGSVGRMG